MYKIFRCLKQRKHKVTPDSYFIQRDEKKNLKRLQQCVENTKYLKLIFDPYIYIISMKSHIYERLSFKILTVLMPRS